MKWNKADKVPAKYTTLILLCEGGTVIFDGEYDGDIYCHWSDDIEMWIRVEKTVIGWMYQAEVRKYLALLPFAE